MDVDTCHSIGTTMCVCVYMFDFNKNLVPPPIPLTKCGGMVVYYSCR